MNMKQNILSLIAILFVSNIGFASSPTDPEVGIESISINLSDVKSLQRGARNFFNYCAGCHSLQYMRYEQIAEDLNISEDKTPQDLVTTNMLKEDGDRWFAKAPPDLTLVTRRKNPDYVYQFLKSFYVDNDSPTGVNNSIQDATSMPHILWLLEEEMTAEDYNSFILDTVTFLEYVGEPIQQKRKSLGIWVISFLVLFLIFSYALYKDIWREVK